MVRLNWNKKKQNNEIENTIIENEIENSTTFNRTEPWGPQWQQHCDQLGDRGRGEEIKDQKERRNAAN